MTVIAILSSTTRIAVSTQTRRPRWTLHHSSIVHHTTILLDQGQRHCNNKKESACFADAHAETALAEICPQDLLTTDLRVRNDLIVVT